MRAILASRPPLTIAHTLRPITLVASLRRVSTDLTAHHPFHDALSIVAISSCAEPRQIPGRTYLDSPSGADPLHYHRLRCCPEVMLVHAQTRPFPSPCQTAPLPSTGLIRFWESQRIWSRQEGNMVMMYIIVQGCRPTLHADYH